MVIKKENIQSDVIMVDVPKEQATPEHASPQMAQLIMEMMNAINKKDHKSISLLRRKIRYRLFRIRDCVRRSEKPEAEHDSGLKRWFELQFRDGQSWDNFTFEWDVSAKEPLKLIISFEWDGEVDQSTKKCTPPAFTKQS